MDYFEVGMSVNGDESSCTIQNLEPSYYYEFRVFNNIIL